MNTETCRNLLSADLRLARHGARHFPGAARDILPELLALADVLAPGRAGVRVNGDRRFSQMLVPGTTIWRLAAAVQGLETRAVRAILFDKTAGTNWALPWHQDRTICVRAHVDTPGYGPWTLKQGLLHVAPPYALLERMMTVRVHLDDVPADNAPLLIAPGSHRSRLLREGMIADVVRRSGVHACLALAGDIWAYATPIVHASDAAMRPARRRVLQIDFSADDLPGRLEWLGFD